MELILQAIIEWERIDAEIKIIIIIGTIIYATFCWLLIYSAVKAAIETALEKRAKTQSNYELALQIKTLEKTIEELQKNINKEK